MGILKALQGFLLKHHVVLKRRYPWEEMPHRRAVLQKILGVDLVVDVGANVGQYGKELRAHGYDGVLVSLEPMAEAVGKLREMATADGNWEVLHAAAGAKPGRLKLQVTENSVSTSLLKPKDDAFSHRVNGKVAREEEVDVLALDGLTGKIGESVRVHVKIDAQGFEDRVLAGAKKLLKQAVLLELEVSFVPIYEGQVDGFALLAELRGMGWVPVSFNAECVDPATMVGLQQDVMLVREEDLAALKA